MRSTTNLAWPAEPFGAGQRPFGRDRPMLAAVGTGWDRTRLDWACAVYLTIVSTSMLSLDEHQLSFGFEVLTPEPPDHSSDRSPAEPDRAERAEQGAVAARLDERLVACRRRAKILAGHDLARDLQRLGSLVHPRRLPGIEGIRRQWADRTLKGRGVARMVDTAYDIAYDTAHDVALPTGAAGVAGPIPITAACEYANLTAVAVADGPAGQDPATDDTSPATGGETGGGPGVTVRGALTRTLAVALIAAADAERYTWTKPLDVDQLVSEAAWDLLGELDAKPHPDEPRTGGGRREPMPGTLGRSARGGPGRMSGPPPRSPGSRT